VSDGTANAPVALYDAKGIADCSAASIEAVLTEADLGRAALRGTNLSGADLRGASLAGSQLDQAFLDGTKLGGANLRGATGIEALATCRIDVGVSGAFLNSGRSPGAGARKTLRRPDTWSGDRAALAFANGRPRPKAPVCFRLVQLPGIISAAKPSSLQSKAG
jgi:hypothetical protein